MSYVSKDDFKAAMNIMAELANLKGELESLRAENKILRAQNEWLRGMIQPKELP